jgi:hypothetical protein
LSLGTDPTTILRSKLDHFINVNTLLLNYIKRVINVLKIYKQRERERERERQTDRQTDRDNDYVVIIFIRKNKTDHVGKACMVCFHSLSMGSIIFP